jgi:hypothetical protein
MRRQRRMEEVMRIWASLALCMFLFAPVRADTLRVGSRVLTSGDSAARVIELLGQPAHRSSGADTGGKRARGAKRGGKAGRQPGGGASTGERWQYRQGGRTVTVVLVQGRVARIE